MTNEIKSLEWDISQARTQVKLCSHGIENGNWKGYSDNLKVRKQRLKEHKALLVELESKIEKLKKESEN